MTLNHGSNGRRMGGWARRMLQGAVLVAISASVPAAWSAGGVQINNVAAGQASLTQAGNVTTIRTASQRTIINYQQLSIATGETLRFLQPNSRSTVLNRIQGEQPTVIDGTLYSNGRVYLVNPAGVMFGNGSVVNVGQLFAAAGHISDANFMSGVNQFTDNTGIVRNQGVINASQIHLVGGSVANFGQIVTYGDGIVTMTAGKDVYIAEAQSPTGQTSVLVKVNSDKSAPKDGTGVTNSGTVNAGNGAIYMGAGDIYAAGIYNNGALKGKDIKLDSTANTNVNEGTIDATSATGKGGTVEMLGDKVGVFAGTIDASGATGGGTILVGGDEHGGGGVPVSSMAVVADGAMVRADATVAGDGGKIIVFASNEVRVGANTISVVGAGGGSGGFVETSGLQNLTIGGPPALGKGGSWLIDPYNLNISSSANASSGSAPNFVAQTIGANLNTTTLANALDAGGGAIVTVSTGASGAQSGDINLLTNLDFNFGGNDHGTLTLLAAGNITFAAAGSITHGGGDTIAVNLSAGGAITINSLVDTGGRPFNSTGGAFTLGGTITTSGSAVTLDQSGAITLNAGSSIVAGTGAIGFTDTSLTQNASSAITGGTLSLTLSGNAVMNATNNAIQGLSVVENTPGSSVSVFNSQGLALLNSTIGNSALSLTVDGVLTMGTATASATGGGTITLTASDMNFTAGSSVISGGNVILLPYTASETIGIGSAAAGNLTITAGLAAIQNVGTLTIGSASQIGNVLIQQADMSASNIGLVQVLGGSGVVTLNHVGGNTPVIVPGSLTISSASIVVTGGSAGAADITATGPSLIMLQSSGGLGVSTANRFKINATNSGDSVQVTAADGVFLQGLGSSLSFGGSSSAGSFDVLAGVVNAASGGGTLTATTGAITVNATTGGIGTTGALGVFAGAGANLTASSGSNIHILVAQTADLSTYNFSAGGSAQTVAIDSAGSLSLTGLNVPSTSALAVNATGTLFANGTSLSFTSISLSGGAIFASGQTFSSTAGAVTLLSGGALTATGSIFSATGGSLALTAGSAGMDVSSSSFTAPGNLIALNSAGSLAAPGATFTATGGTVTLSAGAAGMNLTAANLAANMLTLTSGGGLLATGATLSAASGALVLAAGTSTAAILDVTNASLSASSGVTLTAGSSSIAGSITGTSASILGDNVTLIGGQTGDISVSGSTIAAGTGTLTLTTGAGGAGNITATSSGLTGSKLVLSAGAMGNIDVTFAGLNAGAAGTVTLTTGAGNIIAVNAGFTGNLVSLTTGPTGAINAAQATFTALPAGTILLQAGTGGIAATGSTFDGGSVALTSGANGNIDLGAGAITAGTLSLHAGNGSGSSSINLTGATLPGALNVVSIEQDVDLTNVPSVGAGGTLTLISHLGNMTLGSDENVASLTAQALTIDLKANATVSGNLSLTGNVLIDNAAAGVVLTGGATSNLTISGAINGVGTASALTTSFGGLTTIVGSVGSGTALTSLTVGGGGTLVMGNGVSSSITTTGALLLSDKLILNGSLSIATGSGSVTFGDTVNSSTASTHSSLTITTTGTTWFKGNVGTGAVLGGVSVLGGGVTDLGNTGSFAMLVGSPIHFSGDVVLLANTSLTASGGTTGTVTFDGKIDSNPASFFTLTVTADNAVTFKGNVGSTDPLGALVVNATAVGTFLGAASPITITTSDAGINGVGSQSYNGPLTLVQDATLTALGGATGSITITGLISAPGTPRSLAVNSAGDMTLAGGTSASTTGELFSLQTLGTGTTKIGGTGTITVLTADTQSYGGQVTLLGTTIFQGKTLTFGGTSVSINAQGFDLTLISDSDIFGGGANSVTGSGHLTLSPLAASDSVFIQNSTTPVANALVLAGSALSYFGGFSLTTVGRADGTGTLTVSTATSFGTPVQLLESGGPTGAIVVSAPLSSAGSLGMTAGSISITGAVAATGGFFSNSTTGFNLGAGGSIETFGTTLSITNTTGAVTLDGPLTSGTGSISVSGVGITSNAAGAVTGGVVTLAGGTGAVNLTGAVSASSFLSITGTGLTTNAGATLFGDSVTLSGLAGAILLNDTVTGAVFVQATGDTFTNNSVITSAGISIAATGAVAVNATLNGSGAVSVAGTTITQAVNSPINGTSITLTGTGSVSLSSPINGTSVVSITGLGVNTTGGGTIIGDTVSINGLTSAVTLNQPVNATNGFTSTSAGLFTLASGAGITTTNSNVTITHTNGLVTISSPINAGTGTLTISGLGLTTGVNGTLTAGPVSLTAGTGAVSLSAPVLSTGTLLITGNSVSTVFGANLVASSATINGGTGFVVLGAPVNATNGFFSSSTGLFNLAITSGITTTNSNVTITHTNGLVTISSPINAGTGTLTISGLGLTTGANGTITGGPVSLAGGASSVALAAPVNAAGKLSITGTSVSTTTSATLIATSATINAGTGAIVLNAGVNATNGFTATNSGLFTLASTGGITTTNAPVTITDSGALVTISGPIAAGTGAVSITGVGFANTATGTIVGGPITLGAGSAGANIGGNVTGSGAVSIFGTGVTVGGSTVISGLSVALNSTGSIFLNNSIATFGSDLTLTGTLVLSGAITLQSFGTAAGVAGNIVITGPVDAATAGVDSLNLDATNLPANGNVTLSGIVGGSKALGALNVSGNNFTINSNITTAGPVAISASHFLVSTGGTATVAIVTAGGSFTATAVPIDRTGAGSPNLTINTSSSGAAAPITLGTVGGSLPLGNLTLVATGNSSSAAVSVGTVNINGAFSSAGSTFQNSGVITAQGITISHTGDVSLNGGLSSSGFPVSIAGNKITLAVSSPVTGSTVLFNGAGSVSLSSLLTASSTLAVNGTGGIFTSANGTLTGAGVTLNGGTPGLDLGAPVIALASTVSITANGPINTETGGSIGGTDITINAGTGVVGLRAAVNASGKLTISGASVHDFAGAPLNAASATINGTTGFVWLEDLATATNGFTSTSSGYFLLSPTGGIKTTNAPVTLTHGGSVTLNGSINAGTGVVSITGTQIASGVGGTLTGGAITLLANSGSVSLAAPVVASGALSITGTTGVFTVAGATLSASSATINGDTGPVSLADLVTATNGFTSTSSGFFFLSAGGISTTNAPVTLTHGGSVTLNGSINAGTGAISITGTQITTGAAGTLTGGAVTLLANSGSVSLAAPVVAGGALSITGTTGVFTVAGATLSASSATINGYTGPVSLAALVTATNGFTSTSSGFFLLSAGGIATTNAPVTLTHGGSVTLNGSINAGTGAISITGTQITSGVGGSLTGGATTLLANAGSVSLAAPVVASGILNVIGTTGIFTTAAATLTATAATLNGGTGAITLAGDVNATAGFAAITTGLFTLAAGPGITTTTGPVSINAGSISLLGSIAAGTGSILLTAAGIAQSTGTLTGGTLSLAGTAGSFNLAQVNVASLNANVAGALILQNASALTVTSLTTQGNPLTLSTAAGDLTFTGTSSATIITLTAAHVNINGAMTGSLLNVASALITTAPVIISGNINATGNATINALLTSSAGAIDITGNAGGSGTLTAATAASIGGSFSASGGLSAGGAVSIGVDDTGGPVTAGGPVTVGGNYSGGNISASGVSSSITISGTASGSGTLTAGSFVSVGGGFSSAGGILAGGSVSILGPVTMISGRTIQGTSISLSGGANMTGNLVATTSSILSGGNASASTAIAGNLTAASGTITFTGPATIGGNLTAIAVSIPGDINLGGNTTILTTGSAGIFLGNILGHGKNLTLNASSSTLATIFVGTIGADGTNGAIGDLKFDTDGLVVLGRRSGATVIGGSIFANSVFFGSSAGGILSTVPDHATIINDGDLVIKATGDVTFAEKQKLTVYDSRQNTNATSSSGTNVSATALIWAGGVATLTDLNTEGQLVVSGSSIVLLNRPSGAVAGSPYSPDLGADIVSLGNVSPTLLVPSGYPEALTTAAIRFHGNVTVNNTDANVISTDNSRRFQIGTPNSDLTHTTAWFSVASNANAIATQTNFVSQAPLQSFADFVAPASTFPLGVRDIQVRGSINPVTALPGVPRDTQTITPDRGTAISGALLDYLTQIGINARPMRTDELVTLLFGLGLYDDYPKVISPNAKQFTVAVDRLPSVPVIDVIKLSQTLFDKHDPDGKLTLVNGKPVSRADEVASEIDTAWLDYQKDMSDKKQDAKPAAFRAYLELHLKDNPHFPPALSDINQLRDLLEAIKKLGLTPKEYANAQEVIIDMALGSDLDGKQLLEIIAGPSSLAAGNNVAQIPATAPAAPQK